METEYVSLHVSPELAKKYKQLQTIDGDHAALESYMEDCQKDFRLSMENLDEDLEQYKARVIIWGKTLSDARKEMLDAAYEQWGEYDKELYKASEKAKSIQKKFEPLKSDIESIKGNLIALSDWKIERFIELINKISNMSAQEKKIVTFLMDKQDSLG